MYLTYPNPVAALAALGKKCQVRVFKGMGSSLGALEVLGTFRISISPLGAKLAFFILNPNL